MRIRLAEAGDQPAVYALLCALEECALPERAFAQTYAHNLAQPTIRYWVAEDEGAGGNEVRGFCSLHMDLQLHHAGLVGEIQELIVHEACRSRGVGAELLRAARAEARRMGCSHLELNSGFRRTRAHDFYERNGWVLDHYNFTYRRLREEE